MYNGTGANIVALSAFMRPYHAVICAETAHINVDECGAIEKQSGCKLLTVPTFNGKLTVGLIENHMHGFGDQHHAQPKMVSLTQCTELGTVYTKKNYGRYATMLTSTECWYTWMVHVWAMRWHIWVANLGRLRGTWGLMS